jgi:hypothetical protein
MTRGHLRGRQTLALKTLTSIRQIGKWAPRCSLHHRNAGNRDLRECATPERALT